MNFLFNQINVMIDISVIVTHVCMINMQIGGGSGGDGGDGRGDPQKDLAWRRPLIASILYIVPSQQ